MKGKNHPWAVLLAGGLWSSVSAAQPPAKVHEEMKRLDFLVGNWEVRQKTFNPAGELLHERNVGRLEVVKDLGGQMILG